MFSRQSVLEGEAARDPGFCPTFLAGRVGEMVNVDLVTTVLVLALVLSIFAKAQKRDLRYRRFAYPGYAARAAIAIEPTAMVGHPRTKFPPEMVRGAFLLLPGAFLALGVSFPLDAHACVLSSSSRPFER